MNTEVSVKCNDCGIEYMVPYSSFNAIKRNNRDFVCKQCMKKRRSKMMKERNSALTPEQKKARYKKVSDAQKKNIANMDKESFNKRMAKLNKGKKEWELNKTQEEKDRISKAHTESNLRRWNNMSDEEKQQYSELAKENWQNKTPEEKEAHAQRSRDMWANKTEEEYLRTTSLMSKNKKEWWNDDDNTEVIRDMCDRRMGIDADCYRGEIDYIAGYRFNNYLFAGAGIGLNYDDEGEWDYYSTETSDFYWMELRNMYSIPIYAHARAYLGKKRFQPFFAFSAGANIGFPTLTLGIMDSDGHQLIAEPVNNVTYLFEPAFGLDVRLTSRVSINLLLGFNIHGVPRIRMSDPTHAQIYQKGECDAVIKLGCTF